MDAFRSQIPKPCLSKEDEAYLQRNEKWADTHPYWSDGLFLFIFLVLFGVSVWHLMTIPNFDIFYHYQDVGFSLFCIGMIIYISIHLDVKRKVDAIKNRRSKCPKI